MNIPDATELHDEKWFNGKFYVMYILSRLRNFKIKTFLMSREQKSREG